jgi:hypothetical protein
MSEAEATEKPGEITDLGELFRPWASCPRPCPSRW